MIIIKRMKELANQSSPRKHPLPQPTVQGQLLMGRASLQNPGSVGLSSFPKGEASHSVHTLTHTGLALAQRLGVVLWVAWPWSLYPVTPATDQLWRGSQAHGHGNLGLGSRGYSHGTV